MPKKILNSEQQEFVTTELARFATPTQVQEAIKEAWGIEMTLQAIEGYDPTTVQGSKLRIELKTLFFGEREMAKKSVASLGVAHLPYRMRSLQHVHDLAKRRNNLPVVLSTLQQAAKEMGGAFTNKLRLSGEPDEAPSEAKKLLAQILGCSVDELPAALDEPQSTENPLVREKPAKARTPRAKSSVDRTPPKPVTKGKAIKAIKKDLSTGKSPAKTKVVAKTAPRLSTEKKAGKVAPSKSSIPAKSTPKEAKATQKVTPKKPAAPKAEGTKTTAPKAVKPRPAQGREAVK